MSQKEALELLIGGGPPAVSFRDLGSHVVGVVLDYETTPDTDPKGNVRTWPDGRPRMQIVITLQTELHDDEDDDGRRRIFVNKFGMRTAIAQALREAGWKDNLVGGRLGLQYHANDVAKQRKGENAPKLFRAKFTPPSAVAPFRIEVHGSEPRALPDYEADAAASRDDDIPF